jgi:hypothetical protein
VLLIQAVLITSEKERERCHDPPHPFALLGVSATFVKREIGTHRGGDVEGFFSLVWESSELRRWQEEEEEEEEEGLLLLLLLPTSSWITTTLSSPMW